MDEPILNQINITVSEPIVSEVISEVISEPIVSEVISEPIVSEVISEVITEQKKKGGRPKGSIIADAICRNPELKLEQKKKLNNTYKQTSSYTLSKIKTLSIKYNLNINSNENLTNNELKILLMDLKVNNLINRAKILKQNTLCI